MPDRPDAQQQGAPADRLELALVVSIVTSGIFLVVIDTTVVNVGLGTLSGEFGAPYAQVQWTVTAYLLALAATVPATGWMARRLGSRRVYIGGLCAFTLGAALCATSSSFGELIAFRIIQGFGGGVVMPLGMMIIVAAAGPHRTGRAMSAISVAVVLAPVAGPVLGGYLIDALGWQWMFLINVPLGMLAILAALRLLPRTDLGTPGKLDLKGLGMLAVGMPALVLGISLLGMPEEGGMLLAVGALLAGAALAGAFIRHARHAERPLLDLTLLRSRRYALALAATFLVSAGVFAGLILMPLYFQEVQMTSVQRSGLLMAPQAIGAGIAIAFAGRMVDRGHGELIVLAGASTVAAATLPLVLLEADTSQPLIGATLFLRGLGTGATIMPVTAVAYASLTREQLSDASPQVTVAQRLGATLGTAVMAVILEQTIRAAGGGRSTETLASAFATAHWYATGVAMVALLPCLALLRARKRP